MDNIHVRFGGQLFRQMVGILMGTNCAPLLADLFLYSYENECLLKSSIYHTVILMTLSLSIIKDLRRLFISDIYPKEFTISQTTESTSVASYLDLLFTRDKSNDITTKII